MTPEQLHQIDQARRYAEQDEYAVTRAHIRNLLAIIEQQAASVPVAVIKKHLCTPTKPEPAYTNTVAELLVDGDTLAAGTKLYKAPPEQQAASVPVCEKWAVYYDNKLAGTDYRSGFVEGLGVILFDSENDAREIFSRREDGGIGYRAVKVFVYTAPPAQAASVPDGWKLVPVEPTKKMVDASIYCAMSNKGQTPTGWAIERYKAMLAAAPEAPKS